MGEQADEHYFLKKEDALQGNHYDEDLLQKLDEILPKADASSSAHYRYRKLFVVLHTYGSHFNYQERYPRSFAYFKPDSRSEAKSENRRDLLNAYDNTIRYTDYILHGIIERLQKWEGIQTKTDGVYGQPISAMLYTSDHGENISMMSAASSFMLPRRLRITNCMCLSSSGLLKDSVNNIRIY